MNTHSKLLISATLCSLLSGYSYATVNIGGHAPVKTAHKVMAAGCVQDIGAQFLSINNVRARIMDEGDMWWNPGTSCSAYYVPANGTVSAQFAAALWIGGYDAGGQLKEAAMTYRQNGEDFWTGPIDTATGGISTNSCQAWDKLFYCTRAEVQNWVTNKGVTPNDILTWPGNPIDIANSGGSDPSAGDEAHFLAPFIDVGGTGNYDPSLGDYPAFDLTGNGYCQNELYGDACLWWVINDVGNIHTETNSVPIGLEIREQAFAFQTNDAINNMTFYHYQIINRSSFALFKTYFGFWDDFDLGNGGDNYTGCDVGRSMGYGYCGHPVNNDGSGAFACEQGYHDDPPAVGVVFFQGPRADTDILNHSDSLAKYHYIKNGYIGMARFVYYNNDFTVQGNPTNQTSYYKYLTGFWQDGTPMTYGGNGYGGTLPCDYMFPYTPVGALNYTAGSANTDPTGYGTGGVPQPEWDEVHSADPPGDRRFLESAGPFTLQAGAVNYVITGCVWDQPSSTGLGNTFPIGMIQQDADLAQGLFNNCFKVLNGPDAPDITAQALNKEIILTISNSPTSNNYKEHYMEKDPNIPLGYTDTDYVFQGYEIFQVIDSSVTASELLNNPTKALLVAQCDIQDNISIITNWLPNPSLPQYLSGVVEVNGGNTGIVHSFDIKTDLFQQDGESNLVNDRPYYYIAIAYGYNNYLPYNPAIPNSSAQLLPFIQGRRNIKVYTVIPTIVTSENNGTVQNSSYGAGVPITRLEGHGNGANAVELDQNSINYILANNTMANPTYLPGQGPINVKVVDPLNVVNANFIVKFDTTNAKLGVTNSTRWELLNQTTGEIDYSDTTIGYQNEQVFPQYGISVTIQNVPFPSGTNQGILTSSCSLTFANPAQNWLTGVATAGPSTFPQYWIRSGSHTPPVPLTEPDAAFAAYGPFGNYDPNQNYNQIIGGTWAPYELCAVSDQSEYCDNGPAYSPPVPANTVQYNTKVTDSLGNLASVDIVFTSDQSKWTRCVVLEEQDVPVLAQGGAAKLTPRRSYSIDKNGNFAKSTDTAQYNNPSQANYISTMGMGWFPGYAINVETGERLNMAYGEDSWLTADNGRDMKWNPDATYYSQGSTSGAGVAFGLNSVYGGKHYIYVFGHNHNVGTTSNIDYSIPAYDADSTVYTNLQKGGILWQTRVYNDIMWVNIPLLNTGHQLLECDATVRIRVAKPYDTAYGERYLNGGTSGAGDVMAGSAWRNATPVNHNFPMYSFSTAGLAVSVDNSSAAQSALALINIVPNPYYAYSGYESSGLDTRVRITNLPPQCTISIFTLNGTLIDVINKNNALTYSDWTLMNQYNVPIASGMYLVHVAVPNVGEVTLKWFGVMRPLDLTTY